MEFLEGRDLFGSGPSKEIPCLTGEGKPTTATVGAVGCLYMDTATGALYKCTKAENGVYTWTQEAGLYYTPVVTQPSDTTMQIAFRPSVSGAPTPPPVVVELPAGSSDSGENLGLTVETISNDIEVIGVESISLDYSSIELNSGGTMMLACMVSPSNATNTAIRWESENESVATVDNGLVTAVGAGSTAITAISEDNPSARATCAVSVAAGENTVYFASLAMQDGMYKTDGSLNTGIHG
ncbi:MAG: Ig-like domain-containing protein, partial [Oscillospiraceae bacterium]|nr:Ig-like domain-containing protein [Oscillospiraceae bacterium]